MRIALCLVALAAVLAGCGTHKQASDQEPTRHLKFALGGSAGSSSCGVELWAKKTLTDPQAGQVNLTPTPTTLSALDALSLSNEPGAGQASRAPGELKTWQVTATLTGYKLEADSDYHLVLSGGSGGTLIAEIPSPACDSGSRVGAQIAATRAAFEAVHPQASECFNCLNETVTVTGVGFFDRLHGQTGVAGNGVELHPLLSFTVGGTPVPPVTTGTTTGTTTGGTFTTPTKKDTDPVGDRQECGKTLRHPDTDYTADHAEC
jgi:hypothetical protein